MRFFFSIQQQTADAADTSGEGSEANDAALADQLQGWIDHTKAKLPEELQGLKELGKTLKKWSEKSPSNFCVNMYSDRFRQIPLMGSVRYSLERSAEIVDQDGDGKIDLVDFKTPDGLPLDALSCIGCNLG